MPWNGTLPSAAEGKLIEPGPCESRNACRGSPGADWTFAVATYSSTSNLAKNELRNRSRNPLVLFTTMQGSNEDPDRPLEFEDATSRPDDMYRHRHLRELVEDTVSKLPEHHRQVFVLRELEGKSYEEIAEITHCNLGTVKSRLNRARSAFAAVIGPYVD